MRRRDIVSTWMLAVVILTTLMAVTSVSGQNDGNKTVHVNQVADSVTNLAQKIAHVIASPNSKTEIFSPVSIASVLSLLLLGASGQTKQELLNVLGFTNDKLSVKDIHYAFGRLFQDLVANDTSLEPLVAWRLSDKCNNYDDDDDDDYEDFDLGNMTSPSHLISVVNGMFLQMGLKPDNRFLSAVKKFYQSNVDNLDFERDPNGAAAAINEWCARETNGKIKEMVTPQAVSNSRMIVASALYFKAHWETTFSPYATRPRPFYPGGQQEPPINVETMAATGCFPFYNATTEFDALIIGLPYVSGNSTMYIVMPNGSNRQKLQQLQKTIRANELNSLIDQMITKKSVVTLPKLSISNRIQLSSVLQQLGVRDLFDPARSNLSRVLDATVSLTPTPQTSATQPQNPTVIPFAKPVVDGNPISPTAAEQTKASTESTIQEVVPQHQNVTQPTTTQQPFTVQQANKSTSLYNLSECKKIANCRYSYVNGCTCTIIPTNKPLAATDKRPTSPAVTGNPVALDGLKKPSIDQKPNVTQPTSQQPFTADHRHQPNYFPSKNVEQTMTFRFNRSLCNNIANCSYSAGLTCTCNIFPKSGETIDCATRVASYLANPKKQCFLDNENEEMSGALSCIKRKYKWSTRPATCRQPDCVLYEKKCYCCVLSPTNDATDTGLENGLKNYQQQPENLPTGDAHAPMRKPYGYQPCHHLRNRRQSPPVLQSQSNTPLFVTEVITQVQLDVNEQGTEGGAVTLALIDRIGPSLTLQVDGPFLIFIRHDITKALLFYGAVYDPRP